MLQNASSDSSKAGLPDGFKKPKDGAVAGADVDWGMVRFAAMPGVSADG